MGIRGVIGGTRLAALLEPGAELLVGVPRCEIDGDVGFMAVRVPDPRQRPALTVFGQHEPFTEITPEPRLLSGNR
jgi:hypothetical protein